MLHFISLDILISRIEYKAFSCYNNFVQSDNCGTPTYTEMYHGLQHILELLQNISKKLSSMSISEWIDASLPYRQRKVDNTGVSRLITFSFR